jgi:hypothetical protein
MWVEFKFGRVEAKEISKEISPVTAAQDALKPNKITERMYLYRVTTTSSASVD